MKKSTFNIIYVIQKGKAKADGSAPVVARITVNGEKSHFATRIYVDPACWLPKGVPHGWADARGAKNQ